MLWNLRVIKKNMAISIVFDRQSQSYVKAALDRQYQSFFSENIIRLKSPRFADGDILIFPISLYNRVVYENVLENGFIKKDENGFPIKRNYINIDCIHKGEIHQIQFHPAEFFNGWEEADDDGYGSGNWVKPSGDVISYINDFSNIHEAIEGISSYGCIVIQLNKKKVWDYKTFRVRTKAIPDYYFADCSVINLQEESLYNNKLYVQTSISAIMHFYPFSLNEFIRYQEYFSERNISWEWHIMFNEAIEWDEHWLDLLKNKTKSNRHLGINTISYNKAICWTEELVNKSQVSISDIKNANIKNLSDKFIEDNVDDFLWKDLCKNPHCFWNRERILKFWEKLDFKALLCNPNVSWDSLIFEKVKSQVLLDNNTMSDIVRFSFVPLDMSNIFNELEVFIKQYRADLCCKSDCIIKGLSENVSINWPSKILSHAIKEGLVDIKILIDYRTSEISSGKFAGYVEISEEELRTYGFLRVNPILGIIPLLNFWNIDRVKSVYKDDIDNMASLIENPYVEFDEEMVRHFLCSLQSKKYAVYSDIFYSLNRNKMFYNYLVKNSNGIMCEFDRLLKISEKWS